MVRRQIAVQSLVSAVRRGVGVNVVKEECVWKGGREGVGAEGADFGSNVRLVSGLLMRRSGF